jgi:type VI secretion system protein ImpA
MSDRVYLNEELLQPVSPEHPAGRDLRFEPVFTEIIEARRADEAGKQAPDWRRVADRSLAALNSSKDLRLCCFLTEAGIFLDGFPALRDCLRLTREFLTRFWDRGLYPLIEEGDLDYRAGPLSWFNERLADAIRLIPITARYDGANYSYSHFLQAQRVGTEQAMQRLPSDKLAIINGFIAQGFITMDAFTAAREATSTKEFDGIYEAFHEAQKQFTDFQRIVEDLFGTAAPGFSESRQAFEQIGMLLAETYPMKHTEAAAALAAAANDTRIAQPTLTATRPKVDLPENPAPDVAAWKRAEQLVQVGQVDQGLAQLKALAALETSGRARFLRQLTLVDICRTAKRHRLAQTILEELNRLISEHKLETWESTELIGAVWSRLYRIYSSSENGSEQEQARTLYNQLCRLDPWQTYVDCKD